MPADQINSPDNARWLKLALPPGSREVTGRYRVPADEINSPDNAGWLKLALPPGSREKNRTLAACRLIEINKPLRVGLRE